MAGLFDQLLNQAPDKEWTAGERIASAFPLGIFGALAHKMYREKKNAPTPDMMFQDPSNLDPLGQRVQQRMLERSGGNVTTPGFMAQNMLSQEAQTQPRMANVFDSAAQRMIAAGQGEAGSVLGQYGNKAYGAPVKPNEVSANNANIDPDTRLPRDPKTGDYIPNKTAYKPYSRRIGETMVEGYQIMRTNDKGEVVPGEVVDQTTGTVYSSKISFNPTFDTGVTEAEQSKKITRFGRVVDANEDKINLIQQVIPLISPLTTGWAGTGVEFAGKVGNLFSAVANVAQTNGDYAALQEAFNTIELPDSVKGLPTTEQSVLKALYGALAYAQAKSDNSEGDGQGIRNLSVTDIKDAYVQLGWGASPQAMLKLLQNQLAKSMRDMDRAAEDIADYTGRDPSKYQYKWDRYQNLKKQYGKTAPSGQTPSTSESSEMDEWLEKARSNRSKL